MLLLFIQLHVCNCNDDKSFLFVNSRHVLFSYYSNPTNYVIVGHSADVRNIIIFVININTKLVKDERVLNCVISMFVSG